MLMGDDCPDGMAIPSHEIRRARYALPALSSPNRLRIAANMEEISDSRRLDYTVSSTQTRFDAASGIAFLPISLL